MNVRGADDEDGDGDDMLNDNMILENDEAPEEERDNMGNMRDIYRATRALCEAVIHTWTPEQISQVYVLTTLFDNNEFRPQYELHLQRHNLISRLTRAHMNRTSLWFYRRTLEGLREYEDANNSFALRKFLHEMRTVPNVIEDD